MNPYSHYWPQDFKSCVSTNSTTRAMMYKIFMNYAFQTDMAITSHPDSNRDVSAIPIAIGTTTQAIGFL